MTKRGDRSPSQLAGTMALAAAALGLFLAGEALILTRTDAGRVAAAHYLHLGDRARVREIVSRNLRRALDEAGVPRDSVRETVAGSGEPRVHWRVGLWPRASTLQINYALTRALESQGAVMLSGREVWRPQGGQVVVLVAGLPGRPTHEIELVRAPLTRDHGPVVPGSARIALVLFGLGDDSQRVMDVLSRPIPFAAAIAPGRPFSASVFRVAHERQREVVLHLPMEPLDYPQVSPGPGAILVTMGSGKIESTLRRYLDQSGPVTAVANLMGSLATQDQTVMTAIYRVLRDRRTPFLHMAPAAGAVSKPLAAEQGIAYAEPDVVIDSEAHGTPKTLDARWANVRDLARRRGQAIVMLRATDEVLAWLPGALAPKRMAGVQIVPLATLLRPPPSI